MGRLIGPFENIPDFSVSALSSARLFFPQFFDQFKERIPIFGFMIKLGQFLKQRKMRSVLMFPQFRRDVLLQIGQMLRIVGQKNISLERR
jgi:hypothetical protein